MRLHIAFDLCPFLTVAQQAFLRRMPNVKKAACHRLTGDLPAPAVLPACIPSNDINRWDELVQDEREAAAERTKQAELGDGWELLESATAVKSTPTPFKYSSN